MKKTICMLMVTLGLWSCNNTSSKNEGKLTNESLKTEMAIENGSNMVIKDSSHYDPAFINGLKGYKEPIQLIDNYIIAESDTTYFPENLPLNKPMVFKAAKDHQTYLLTVTRTSLTNLSYSFKRTGENDKLMDSKSGNAVLGSMFFLASEMDEDTQSAEGYGSYEYWDKTTDCWFALRIGQGNDLNGKQRAMINYGCEDKNKQALALNECPTLRTE